MVISTSRKYEVEKRKDPLKIFPRTQCIKKQNNLVEMQKQFLDCYVISVGLPAEEFRKISL